MITAELRGRDYAYQALIGSGLLGTAGTLVGKVLPPGRCAIVSEAQVAPLFADRVAASLATAGFQPTLITVAAGEKSKALAQVGAICDQLVEAGFDRKSFIVGLGGGVIGDLGGFVAAVYHRGIPHVQIPTTLLAMVDSSIGGKTGVNTSSGKNLIGAVHQPALVLDDVDVLKTLPAREFNQGFAEIIKHAVIADAEMFRELRKMAQASGLRIKEYASETLALQSLIHRNIEIKAAVVAKDEMDRTGERALLNFGHTVGHAIEAAGAYGDFFHGEAVSLGMVAAASVSAKKAGLPREDQTAIVDLLRAFQLPTQLPSGFPREKILEALPRDKKFEGGQTRFVVTPKIGSASLSSGVTLDDIREAVEEL